MAKRTSGALMGKAELVPIRTFADARGSLSVLEAGMDLPFMPRRLYYLYGNVDGVVRGDHAHKTLCQMLVVLSGAADVVVDDGISRTTWHLSFPDRGLLLYPVVWREIHNMTPQTGVAVLVSDVYDENDYIRDYDAFISYVKGPD